jgi:hypothetical protein
LKRDVGWNEKEAYSRISPGIGKATAVAKSAAAMVKKERGCMFAGIGIKASGTSIFDYGQ